MTNEERLERQLIEEANLLRDIIARNFRHDDRTAPILKRIIERLDAARHEMYKRSSL